MKKRLLTALLTLCLLATCLIPPVVASAEPLPATETIAPLSGASIRVGSDASSSGLRFAFAVNMDWYDGLEGEKTLGALIVPTDTLGANTFTKEALTTAGVRFLDLSGGVWNDESTETVGCYYASIVSLLDQNYTRAFSAVGYVTDGTGATHYSAVSDSRSVYEVAKGFCLSDDYAGASAGTKSRVASYLDSVVALDETKLTTVSFENYTSPYTVAYADGTLTVDGAVSGIKTVLIGTKPYTKGLSVSDGKLTVSYTHTTHTYDRTGSAADGYWLKCSGCGATALTGIRSLLPDSIPLWLKPAVSPDITCVYPMTGNGTGATYTQEAGGEIIQTWGKDASGAYRAVRILPILSDITVDEASVLSYSFDINLTNSSVLPDAKYALEEIKLQVRNITVLKLELYTTNKTDETGFWLSAYAGDKAEHYPDSFMEYGVNHTVRVDFRFTGWGSAAMRAVSADIFVDGMLVAVSDHFLENSNFNLSATGNGILRIEMQPYSNRVFEATYNHFAIEIAK